MNTKQEMYEMGYQYAGGFAATVAALNKKWSILFGIILIGYFEMWRRTIVITPEKNKVI